MKKIINTLYHLSDTRQTGKFMSALTVLTAALVVFIISIAFFTSPDGVQLLQGGLALATSIAWGWFSKYLFEEINWSTSTV